MQLTQVQKQQFIQDGFIVTPGVIPQAMVHDALRAINHSIGEGIPPEDLPIFRAQGFCREIRGTPVITDLFNRTPLFSLCESLIGEGNFGPAGGGQIALRFPTMQDPPRNPGPHLDGMYTTTNGVKEGTIANFTMLVGVYLSDVLTDFAGNLSVWPGSHHIYERYFRENGPESLLNGMPKVEVPPGHQVKARAGDAVLCHYQLGHGVTPNVSPFPRYGIFFRIKHHEHDANSMEVMTDIWKHWTGLHELLGREAASAERVASNGVPVGA